jgi:hypothetical protein
MSLPAPRLNWIERAEAALDGTAADPATTGVELLLGRPPPILDAYGRRALLVAPLLAAFMIAAASFLEQLRGPLDPIGLVLRLLALCLVVRSVVLWVPLVGRIRTRLHHRHYKLALTEAGLLLRTPQCDLAVEKRDIIDVCEQLTARKEREPGWSLVFLVTRPQSGRLYVSIPPVFASKPSLLVEQLTGWLSADLDAEADSHTDADAPSGSGESSATIPWRRGLTARGPYATVLLGVVLLEGYLRMPEAMRAQLTTLVTSVVVACMVVLPLAWLSLRRVRMGPRDGAALMLSTSEFIVSTRRGPQHIRWREVTKVEAQVNPLWSLLEGVHEVRALVLRRFGLDTIRRTDDTLETPIEVVSRLCEAYRTGLLS